MKLIQMLRESFLNVMRNKLRTALTMLGLIIGIASVIVLVGIGDGSNKQVAERIQSERHRPVRGRAGLPR